MRLNTLTFTPGTKTKAVRVGRGIGCGKGKTCGRGHKGQHARNNIKQGMEGGQMPLHRRLPKTGFNSWRSRCSAELRLSDLNKIDSDVIDMAVLKENRLVRGYIKFVKIIAQGEFNKAVTLRGLDVSAGAKKMVEAAGGKIED